jgi:hypothetical protein
MRERQAILSSDGQALKECNQHLFRIITYQGKQILESTLYIAKRKEKGKRRRKRKQEIVV